MSISKQLPLVSKPDAYTYSYTGPSSTSFTASRIPTHLNGYFEINQNGISDSRKAAFCKRPGCLDTLYASLFTNLATAAAAERIKGLTTSLDKTKVLFISQNASRYTNFYDATTNTLTRTDVSATFAGGEYVFTQLDNINFGPNVAYVSTNGTEGALYTSTGVASVITDVDYTGLGTKTCFVGLDGYLFFGVISGTGAGRIYNSDLSAAAAASGWTATSYISAYDVPGAIVWLGRIRNYIVCFKQGSLEFFENVGAPTPGSPLAARKGLTKNIGCASASSVQYVHDGIIFLGIDKNGKQGVYKINTNDLSVTDISNASIEMTLHNGSISVANFQSYSNDFESAGNVAKAQSQVIVWHNKELYMVTLQSYLDGFEISMVYDNELDLWYQWATNFLGPDFDLQDRHFIPSMCFQLTAGASGGIYTMFVNNYTSITQSRFNVFITSMSGTLAYRAWQDSYNTTVGDFKDFPIAWQSEHFDFGTQDRKFMNAIEVIWDSPQFSGGGSIPSGIMGLRLSRMQGAAGNYVLTKRTITSATPATNRIRINRLGSFRSAAISLYAYGPFPIRIWAVECIVSGGPEYA